MGHHRCLYAFAVVAVVLLLPLVARHWRNRMTMVVISESDGRGGTSSSSSRNSSSSSAAAGFLSLSSPLSSSKEEEKEKNEANVTRIETDLLSDTEVEGSGGITKTTRIIFLKTHKTASSTVSAIFHRFGFHRGLDFVLPLGHKFNWPTPLRDDSIDHYNKPTVITGSKSSNHAANATTTTKPPQYDILCNHAVYSPLMRDLVPGGVLVSIVRHPVARLLSAVEFFALPETAQQVDHYLAEKKSPAAAQWLALQDTFRLLAETPLRSYSQQSHYDNAMALDMGVPLRAAPEIFEETLGRLRSGSMFDLILVAEYLDVSLVLLKRLLNWDLLDVVYASMKTTSHRTAHDLLASGGNLRRRFRSNRDFESFWSLIRYDDAIYRYANDSLWQRVEREGRDSVLEEAAELRRMNGEINSFCAENCILDVSRQEDSLRYRREHLRFLEELKKRGKGKHSPSARTLSYNFLVRDRARCSQDQYVFCLDLFRDSVDYTDMLRQIAHSKGKSARHRGDEVPAEELEVLRKIPMTMLSSTGRES